MSSTMLKKIMINEGYLSCMAIAHKEACIEGPWTFFISYIFENTHLTLQVVLPIMDQVVLVKS